MGESYFSAQVPQLTWFESLLCVSMCEGFDNMNPVITMTQLETE